jgi:NAD(P)-dependent dehydrogenase (short-subunit alcohol dehydrogenase family)
MNDVFDLRGRVALVTGGTRGIGAAIAIAFRERGATVAIHGRSDASSEAFADEHGFVFLSADLSDLRQADDLARATLERLGGLDILVNNAGMEINATVEHLDLDAASRQLAVNLEAPIRLTHHLVPALRRSSKGAIINVTSIHGTVPSYGNSVYCAAKAGLELFTRTLAIELGPAGVRVNALAPGTIETDMNREILDEIGRENFAEWIPLGFVGSTGDIAHAAVFLASDASRYVTGATLVVDGGYSHHVVRYRMPEVV